MGERATLVERLSDRLANRVGRRSFLARTAIVGSALTVAPADLLLRPTTAYAAVCSCVGPELHVRRAVLRRLHRVLLHDLRGQRLPAGHGGGRLVEGRRLGLLRRPALLHGLQRRLRWLRVRRHRAVLGRLLGHRLRVRQRQLQRTPGRLQRVPLRPVQPGRALPGSDRVPPGHLHPTLGDRGQLHHDTGHRQLHRPPRRALPARAIGGLARRVRRRRRPDRDRVGPRPRRQRAHPGERVPRRQLRRAACWPTSPGPTACWSTTATASSASHGRVARRPPVCAYALNEGPGTSNPLLGCLSVAAGPGVELPLRPGRRRGRRDPGLRRSRRACRWPGTGTRGRPTRPPSFHDGRWRLRDALLSTGPRHRLPFGSPGDLPVAGDWNGDGIDTVGVFRNGIFYLRNSNTSGVTPI